MATSVCKECGIEYQSPPSRKRQFCSADCYWSFRHANPFDNDLTVTCTQCKREFKLRKAKVERSEKLFCSTECMGLHMRASVDASKTELERMYIDEQWSMERIARKYNVSASTIRRILDSMKFQDAIGSNGDRRHGSILPKREGVLSERTAKRTCIRCWPNAHLYWERWRYLRNEAQPTSNCYS